MAYTSPFSPAEVIIDDSTSTDVTHDPKFGRGLVEAVGYAGTPAEPFPTELVIPKSEWQARIQELDETGRQLSARIRKAGIAPKNQGQTNYCWIFGPTGASEIVRTVIQNQPYVELSPTSCGAVIKNFRNQGGWGKEGLQFICDRGVVPASMWPINAINKQYDKPEAWAEAKKYICTEWWELRPKNMDQLISCLLHGIPVAVGYNWWGHEVYACDAVWRDGTVVIRIRNSWGMWGDNGFGLLEGSKMNPDDAVAPRVLMAA